MEAVKFTMPRHKDALSAHTYTTTVDNIVYRMLVADYSDRIPFGASILEEALFQHTEADDHGLRNGKILGNDTARIEPVVRGATYGRRITMDYPNGQGRNLTTFYFRDGKLYEMSVQILPANGDYGSPTGSRFVEVAGLQSRAHERDRRPAAEHPRLRHDDPAVQVSSRAASPAPTRRYRCARA